MHRILHVGKLDWIEEDLALCKMDYFRGEGRFQNIPILREVEFFSKLYLKLRKSSDYDVVLYDRNRHFYKSRWWFPSAILIHFRDIMSHLFVRTAKPLFVYDLSDELGVQKVNRALLRKADLYFKRELGSSRSRSLETLGTQYEQNSEFIQKLRPLPITFERPQGAKAYEKLDKHPIDFSRKKYDLIFIGAVENRRDRQHIPQLMNELGKLGYSIYFAEGNLSHEEYMNLIKDSWFCYSPRGLGWDCYRHYEVAAVGCVPILPLPDIERYMPLRNGEECFFVDEGVEVLSQVIEILNQKESRKERVANASFEKVWKYHTRIARTSYLLDELDVFLNDSL